MGCIISCLNFKKNKPKKTITYKIPTPEYTMTTISTNIIVNDIPKYKINPPPPIITEFK